MLFNYYEANGCNCDLLTWHKKNPCPACANRYISDTEYCVYARSKGVRLFGRSNTKHKYWITNTNKADKRKYQHPTIKPLHIIENLVFNSSKEGEVILDPYMGTGTTGVACRNLNREFIGIEINEQWFNIAQQRLNEPKQMEINYD